MDETLARRLLGATVLLLLAFGLASLLPGPDGEPGKSGQPVVAYDLRTGRPLNLPLREPPPPPVRLKPVQIGATPAPEPAPDAAEPDAGRPQTTAPVKTPAAVPTPVISGEGKTATPSAAANPVLRSGHPSLKVDESFGAATNTSWYVQVGSFSSRDNARSVLQKLFKQGLPAMMQNVTVGKALWYRVRVGPYASETPAQQALSAVRAQGYPAAKVVRPDAGGN